MNQFDDERLALVLASVGELLVTDGSTVPARRRWSTSAIVAAAAAVTALTVAVVVAPVRSTVADWLGLGSTRIEIDPAAISDHGPLPSIDAGLVPIDQTAAEERLGRSLPVLDSTSLGEPVGFARMPEGGVLVVWPDTSTLWIHTASLDARTLYEKLASAGEDVQPVSDVGEEALVIAGEHILRTPHRTLAADTTVLWTSGQWELRLESGRDPAEVVELARQLAAGD